MEAIVAVGSVVGEGVAQMSAIVQMARTGGGEPRAEVPKDHDHHTVPHEIREKLPAHLRNDPDLKKTVPVDPKKHLREVHDKKGISTKETGIFGGRYNLRFHEEIRKAGGYDNMTKKKLLEIAALLLQEFGL